MNPPNTIFLSIIMVKVLSLSSHCRWKAKCLNLTSLDPLYNNFHSTPSFAKLPNFVSSLFLLYRHYSSSQLYRIPFLNYKKHNKLEFNVIIFQINIFINMTKSLFFLRGDSEKLSKTTVYIIDSKLQHQLLICSSIRT